MTLATTPTSKKQAPKPHFTHLPREIRLQILEYCLVVSGPINPYPAYYDHQDVFHENDRRPDVGLLRVNKSVNLEATRILDKENTWRMSGEVSITTAYMNELSGEAATPISFIHRDLLKHIVTRYDLHDVDVDGLLHHRLKTENILYHEHRSWTIASLWAKRIELLLATRPPMVTLEFTTIFCPLGCCRMDAIGELAARGRSAWHPRTSVYEYASAPQSSSNGSQGNTHVEFIGLETERERRQFRFNWLRPDHTFMDANSEKLGLELDIAFADSHREASESAGVEDGVCKCRQCVRNTQDEVERCHILLLLRLNARAESFSRDDMAS